MKDSHDGYGMSTCPARWDNDIWAGSACKRGGFGGTQQQPLVPVGTTSRKWSWVLHSNAWLDNEEQQTLKQERFRMDVRGNFFSMRTVQQWHRLPTEAVQSPSLGAFKTYLIQSRATWSCLTADPGLSRSLDWRPLEVPSNLNFPVICISMLVTGDQVSIKT